MEGWTGNNTFPLTDNDAQDASYVEVGLFYSTQVGPSSHGGKVVSQPLSSSLHFFFLTEND